MPSKSCARKDWGLSAKVLERELWLVLADCLEAWGRDSAPTSKSHMQFHEEGLNP